MSSPSPGMGSKSSQVSQDNENDDIEPPESESRRLLELRLLQNYFVSVFIATPAVWSFKEAPRIALEPGSQDLGMLYAIFCYSATNIIRKEPGNVEMASAQQRYLTLAIQKHRRAVLELGSHNAAPVCFISLMILSTLFSNESGREMVPYSPPMEWLRMGNGVQNVFSVIVDNITNWDMSRVGEMFDSTHWLSDLSRLFVEENRKDFLYLLQPDASGDQWQGELLDPRVRESYEKTLSYIGSCYNAFNDAESAVQLCRRLLSFAIIIPSSFVELLAEQRPRALVILAHFYALVARLPYVWLFGDTGKREVSAIQKAISPGWQQEMHQCFIIAGIDTSSEQDYSIFPLALSFKHINQSDRNDIA
ncbi:hypothetical protein MW887_000451 [Aspergillus wentii]|nr:hypothetical protein MW887_000451 [Aspergillus wentii]